LHPAFGAADDYGKPCRAKAGTNCGVVLKSCL
jgi:hypothetical protein